MYCSIVKLNTKFIVRTCNKVKNNGEIKIKKRRFNEKRNYENFKN